MKHLLRRVLRGSYWVGLFLGPFFGTAVAVGILFVGVHALGQANGVLPLVCAALGVPIWMGLIYGYRKLVSLPCEKCGRGARAVSLNPVTVRCSCCGHIQQINLMVRGAP